MTQDNFAAAEQIGATLDVLAAALLDGRATHYPIASLTGFRRDAHPSASALFGLRLSPSGPGTLTVRGLGTVVEGSTARPIAPEATVATELLTRFGGGAVRGVFGSAHGVDAEQFQLPVGVERTEDKLRPAFPAALAELAADRPTTAPEELSTGTGVEVRLVLPSVFHALTARGAAATRIAQLAEVAEELFAGSDVRARKEWAVLTAALGKPSSSAGTLFAGVSALRVSGRPSHASLVISLTHRPGQISELATQLADTRPLAEVWTVLLPAGPAAVLVEERTSPIPAALSNDGQPYWTSSSVAQAFVPLPDGASVLVIQLSVAQPEDWELYMGSFAEVLKSVQLGWDGVYAPQPAIPAQAPAHLQAQPAPSAAPAPAPVADSYPATPSQPQPQPQPQPADVPAVPSVPPLPPAAPATPPAPAAEQPAAPKGTPVAVPPADFNPFAPPAPAPAAAADTSVPEPRKGTPVAVPPADFNPFAPPAPAATAATDAAEPRKGTPVTVPPADFNPFAAAAPSTNAAAPAVPAPAAAPAPQPAPTADPFGTVMNNQPADPFGTVTTGSSPAAAPAQAQSFTAPPPPSVPPTIPAPAKSKGTPVTVPPADFNPFAPPAPADNAPATAEEQDEPTKGTPVNVPPPDFNPFAAPSAPPAAQAAAPAAPEPATNNPFG
ncbi:hypothetical protein ACFC1R_19745 [Kitasatospora sp. NPDC056138]|uniref:hypothetical protein n=1 Tax=Kitasatospora sp. NPDC056138 TaxID=3345724 RepID=UPI0035E082AF